MLAVYGDWFDEIVCRRRAEIFWSGVLVGWLVGSFVMFVVISHQIRHRRSAYVPNFTTNLSEVKVKVQGQNRRVEYISPVGL